VDSDIAHPVASGIKPDEIARRFVQYRHESADPLWNFHLLMDRAGRAEARPAVIEPGGPPTSLVLLTRPDPPCDVEIFGQWLPAEVHPADWLDLYLAAGRVRPISARYVRMPAGAVGDVVGTWTANDVQWIGRFFCLKAGARLFLLRLRAREADYPYVADDFFASIASFTVTEQGSGPFAEEMRWIEQAAPIRCRVALPVSWEVTIEPSDEALSAFHADLISPGVAGPALVARLSFGLSGPEHVPGHQEAFADAMEAVRGAGWVISPNPPERETALSPFSESWLSISPAQVNDQKAQLRCRVLRHSGAWIVVLVICIDAQTSPWAWMRAKRALDIATSFIEIT
jgi:hypothetical protein